MNTETVKATFTYVIALVIIVGGGLLLVIPTQLAPSELLPFLTGAIGVVLGYVFGERSATSGANNATPTTVYAAPPSTVNVAGAGTDIDGETTG